MLENLERSKFFIFWIIFYLEHVANDIVTWSTDHVMAVKVNYLTSSSYASPMASQILVSFHHRFSNGFDYLILSYIFRLCSEISRWHYNKAYGSLGFICRHSACKWILKYIISSEYTSFAESLRPIGLDRDEFWEFSYSFTFAYMHVMLK